MCVCDVYVYCVNVLWTWLWFSCPCQDGNLPPPATLLIILVCSDKYIIPVSVAGGLSRPGLCSDAVLGVWDHFRLLDVPLCYCASETMWPFIFHTPCSYQRFSSFAQKTIFRWSWKFMSGTLVNLSSQLNFSFSWCCFNYLLSVEHEQFLEQYSSPIFLLWLPFQVEKWKRVTLRDRILHNSTAQLIWQQNTSFLSAHILLCNSPHCLQHHKYIALSD